MENSEKKLTGVESPWPSSVAHPYIREYTFLDVSTDIILLTVFVERSIFCVKTNIDRFNNSKCVSSFILNRPKFGGGLFSTFIFCYCTRNLASNILQNLLYNNFKKNII